MYEQLQTALCYRFRDRSLLRNALTHSSYANENRGLGVRCNERLEFLGDSVLGFVVANALYRRFPDRPEGEMTRMRADMVCETTLAQAAKAIGLGEELLLGHGEEQGGGRTRPSILADAMESVIAAAYLDGGLEAAQGIIERLILVNVPEQQLRQGGLPGGNHAGGVRRQPQRRPGGVPEGSQRPGSRGRIQRQRNGQAGGFLRDPARQAAETGGRQRVQFFKEALHRFPGSVKSGRQLFRQRPVLGQLLL